MNKRGFICSSQLLFTHLKIGKHNIYLTGLLWGLSEGTDIA